MRVAVIGLTTIEINVGGDASSHGGWTAQIDGEHQSVDGNILGDNMSGHLTNTNGSEIDFSNIDKIEW